MAPAENTTGSPDSNPQKDPEKKTPVVRIENRLGTLFKEPLPYLLYLLAYGPWVICSLRLVINGASYEGCEVTIFTIVGAILLIVYFVAIYRKEVLPDTCALVQASVSIVFCIICLYLATAGELTDMVGNYSHDHPLFHISELLTSIQLEDPLNDIVAPSNGESKLESLYITYRDVPGSSIEIESSVMLGYGILVNGVRNGRVYFNVFQKEKDIKLEREADHKIILSERNTDMPLDRNGTEQGPLSKFCQLLSLIERDKIIPNLLQFSSHEPLMESFGIEYWDGREIRPNMKLQARFLYNIRDDASETTVYVRLEFQQMEDSMKLVREHDGKALLQTYTNSEASIVDGKEVEKLCGTLSKPIYALKHVFDAVAHWLVRNSSSTPTESDVSDPTESLAGQILLTHQSAMKSD